jgi:uncharacterized protein involved in exopolysaccharide biosynthesis
MRGTPREATADLEPRIGMATYTSPPTHSADTPAHLQWTSNDVTVADILRLLAQNRWLLIALPLTLGLIAGVWSFTRPRTYTATAAFAAQSGGTPFAATGLAAQLGLGIGSPGGEGPAYYAEVIKSSAVLRAVADSSIQTAAGVATVAAVMGVTESDVERRRSLTAESLRGMIRTSPSRETGIVRVDVTAADPNAAAQLGAHLLAELIEFNLTQRQTQAARERAFAGRQLSEARAQVRAAEGLLADFLVRNRQYQSSPQLAVEYERLQRTINERQQVASSLMQAYDQARLEEVRNIPRIAVLEPPLPPLRGNSRGTPKKALAGMLAGLVLAIGFVLGREYFRAAQLIGGRVPVAGRGT